MHNRYRVLAVTLSVWAASFPTSSWAAAPALYNLGTFPAGRYSEGGHAINASGQVAGESPYAPRPPFGITPIHAFRYDGLPGSGGVMVDLGSLGGSGSQGYGINDSGQVVGRASLPGGESHAFRTAPNSVINPLTDDLGTLGGSYSTAIAINAIGQVVGRSYTGSATGSPEHAFRTAPNAAINPLTDDLGTLGGSTSYARGINDSGQVAGSSRTATNFSHAFRTAPNAAINPLTDDLGTLGGSISSGWDINASGQVVGNSSMTGDSESHAFLYTGTPGSGGAMADLGTLGGTYSLASAINTAGYVVGNSRTIDDSNIKGNAFIYIGTPGRGGAMIDLDAWLDAVNPSVGEVWKLEDAFDINDAGLITGFGRFGRNVLGIPKYGNAAPAGRAFILDASSIVNPRPGDADFDTDVDLTDLGKLASNFGLTDVAGWMNGDFDRDGDVDQSDLGILATNYGLGQAQAYAQFQSLSGIEVPEPTSLALLSLASVAARRLPRRRGRGMRQIERR